MGIRIEPDPTCVADRDNRSWSGRALDSSTSSPPLGAGSPRLTVASTWRFCPTVTPSVKAIPGAITVAARAENYAAKVKPSEALAESVVIPGVPGWNSIVAFAFPPPIFTLRGEACPTA